MRSELSAALLGRLRSGLGSRRFSPGTRLERNKRYLQIAFNGSLDSALAIIPHLPRDERILVEAGTPLVKEFGANAISEIKGAWGGYVVADIKSADGGAIEAAMAAQAGANGVTVLGSAPIETVERFIVACESLGVDSMVDMLGVADPLGVLRPLVRHAPSVVILHRGRDEESTRGKVIGYRHVKRVKSKFDVLISAAGGVDLKEAQTASFNGANIVVVNVVEPGQQWAGLSSSDDVENLAVKFLESID
jgi:bifunctional enzyme Fae/Hps